MHLLCDGNCFIDLVLMFVKLRINQYHFILCQYLQGSTKYVIWLIVIEEPEKKLVLPHLS